MDRAAYRRVYSRNFFIQTTMEKLVAKFMTSKRGSLNGPCSMSENLFAELLYSNDHGETLVAKFM